MPYEWSMTRTDAGPVRRLRLWPHRSLPRRGFAAFVLVTFAGIMAPLVALLGTVLLWGLLPFVLLAVAGIWWGLRRSYRDGRLCEVLTIGPQEVRLVRTEPGGQRRDWACESYWARVRLHASGGPVPHYVTLLGRGREVEIGAFLSEAERKALHGELDAALRQMARPGAAR